MKIALLGNHALQFDKVYTPAVLQDLKKYGELSGRIGKKDLEANAVPVAQYAFAQITLAAKGYFQAAKFYRALPVYSLLHANTAPGLYGCRVGRVLLFSLNYAGGSAITIMMGKWNYYTQNVLQPGILFASVHLPIRLLDAVMDPLIANLFDRYGKNGKFRLFMIAGALTSLLPALIVFFYPGATVRSRSTAAPIRLR